MKKQITNYVFDASAKTIKFVDYTKIYLNGVLLITNVTDNTMIYLFNDSSLGGTVIGNVLTLTYNTVAMDDLDTLQIFYDDTSLDSIGKVEGSPLYIDSDNLSALLEDLTDEVKKLRTVIELTQGVSID